MSPPSPAPERPPNLSNTSREVAGRLFARALGGAEGDTALLAAAEMLCARLADGLALWFGPEGSRALVARALARVQPAHPSLASLTVGSRTGPSTAPCLTGLAEIARTHGAASVVGGFVALLAALTEGLRRLLGDELGVRIFEQTAGFSDRTALAVDSPSRGSVASAGRPIGLGGVEKVRADIARPPADPELPTMVDEP